MSNSPTKMEIIYDLYMRMKIEQKNIKAGTQYLKNPWTGRVTMDTPDRTQYWINRAKLDGFLMALDWNYEEINGELYIRRNSDGRLKVKIQIVN